MPRHYRPAPKAWSAEDLLCHLYARHELFLGWEHAGSLGGRPEMPAPGYGWGDTPALDDAIWRRTRDDTLEDVTDRLAASYREVRRVVASHSDEDPFTKRRFRWTGSTSVGSYAVSAISSHYA